MNEKRPIPVVVDEKRDLHQRLWMSKSSGIGLFLLFHSLWYRSLFIHPQPLV
jgi:hypothetical protein